MSHAMLDLARHLLREPMRAFLTLLGIVIGTASIVFLASNLTAAVQALERASQEATGNDIIQVERRGSGPTAQFRTAPGLSETDARAIEKHEDLPRGSAGSSVTLYSQEASVGSKRRPVGVQSGGTEYAKLSNFRLLHGRWLLPEEDGTRVCVIGYDIWKDLFDSTWPLPTDALTLNHGTRLVVVGVLERKPPIGGGDGDGTWKVDRRVLVSNRTFARTIRSIDQYDEIAMRRPESTKGESPKQIALRLTPYLQNLHQGVKNFEFSALSRGNQLDTLIYGALSVVLLGCAFVSTIVGTVNVMNAQLVLLHERTKEYGIRRALGLSARRLRLTVLMESMTYALFGCCLGVSGGLASAWGLSTLLTRYLMPWPFHIIQWSLATAVLGAAVAGLLAGWLPAKRASAIVVADCLRSD